MLVVVLVMSKRRFLARTNKDQGSHGGGGVECGILMGKKGDRVLQSVF